jgi:hypothetical protein
MQHELIGMGHIDGDELHAGFHQAGYKMHLTRQPIETGNYQDGAALAASGQCKRQLRAVILLAAFDLGKFFGNTATVGHVAPDGFALRIEAKATFALPVGRYPKIRHKRCHASIISASVKLSNIRLLVSHSINPT